MDVSYIVTLVIVALLVIAIIALVEDRKRKRLEKKKSEQEEQEKACRYAHELDDLFARTLPLLDEFSQLLDFASGYIMKKDWEAVALKCNPIVIALERIPQRYKSAHCRSSDFETLIRYVSSDETRITRNTEYKKHELQACEQLFNSIDGKSLDGQQRNAIVTDEYNNLVIAGAGSGKTLTVVGKVKYLVEHKKVPPERILVTSFTRKSVAELALRITKSGVKGVCCKNFHAIGLQQLQENQYGVCNENMLSRCIQDYLRTIILKDAHQIQAFLDFYGCYAHLPKNPSEYDEEGSHCEELKACDLQTVKGRIEQIENLRKADMSTLHGERVKSLEELMIANYLYLHGIEYEYEKNYIGDYDKEGRAYQPDFYLTQYDIWLEHFGIDEHGRAPWIKNAFEERKYIEGMAWKRQVHAENRTKLIESYSYWNKDQDLLNKLESLLKDNGVVVVEDKDYLAGIYSRLNQDNKYRKSIVALLQTFLSLAKANNVEMAEVWDRGREEYFGNGYMWHRFQLFMTFASPIMDHYQKTLASKKQIDFDDMINLAARSINENGIGERYEYIIVDEYQDISLSRFGLIRAIREKTGAKLICVGDDWQSIYRFAGSDVTLFTNFNKYVGYSETLKIETTYRNSRELVDAASSFVEANPCQIKKNLRAVKTTTKPIVILSSGDMVGMFESSLDSILSSSDNYQGQILVLGRHNFDLENLYPSLENTGRIKFRKDRASGDIHINYQGYDNIVFMSVHRAKGLEADDVIVINLVNNLYGFPNRVTDDPILTILLDNEDSYEFAEERRLFYVALTRTKRAVYLVADQLEGGHGASPFVKELIAGHHEGVTLLADDEQMSPVKCPRCGTGNLVIRKNTTTGKEFLGCTNYPFCDKSYKQIEILEDRIKCPRCGGWMVRRKRRSDNKEFFGCSNYPDCTATIDSASSSRFDYRASGM